MKSDRRYFSKFQIENTCILAKFHMLWISQLFKTSKNTDMLEISKLKAEPLLTPQNMRLNIF
jgi:hypothetical protein